MIAFFGNPAEAAIAMRQARELGIKQPFFVGSNMVDPSLITAARNAEGVTGFSLIPFLPGSNAGDEAVGSELAQGVPERARPAGRTTLTCSRTATCTCWPKGCGAPART
jgi:hypothetical protein